MSKIAFFLTIIWNCFALLKVEAILSSTCNATVENKTCFGHPGHTDINTTDLDACCAACMTNNSCVAFTINHDQSICHLKEEIAQVHSGHCTSGIVRPKPPTPAPPTPGPPPPGSKNVLLLVSDDMRPNLPMYGDKIIYAPNLARLAADGVTFNRAYIQISYCCPSRNSFMSGRRPDTAQAWNFLTNFREAPSSNRFGNPKQWNDMPQWFKSHGYWSAGTGKLWHNGKGYNDKLDWSDLDKFPYINAGHALADTDNTDVALSHLRYAANLSRPFFIGMGFHKPHLPWVYPTKSKDRGCCPRSHYPNVSDIPTAKHPEWPKDTNPIAWHQCAECASEFYKPFSESKVRQKRVDYYSAITYVDWNIGRILDLLDELELTNNTAVVFFGDHGWQLGEHNMWCKMSVFELGTRIPLLFRAPWLGETSKGVITNALAEAIDVFPTLAELAGIPVSTSEKLQGQSLVPILSNPHHATVKQVALSQFPRCWQNETKISGRKCGDEKNQTNALTNMCDCHWAPSHYIDFMGYSMRTLEWRYTEWVRWNKTSPFYGPIWSDVFARELYDHRNDTGVGAVSMDEFENINLANHPEYKDLIQQLGTQLKTEFNRWIPNADS